MIIRHLFKVVVIVLGLFLATMLYFHIKRGKLIPETWPRLFGIGVGAVMFVGLMIRINLRGPLSEVVDDTVSNFIWSLAFGIAVYIGGRTIARRIRDKK